MNITNFAHNGVEHATPSEAATHAGNNNLTVILAISAVAVLAILVVVKLLSSLNKEPVKKEKKS